MSLDRAEDAPQPPVPSRKNQRLKKFFAKDPQAMSVSVAWNLRNLLRALLFKLRFGFINWGPSGSNPSYLAYYPDGLRSFPDLTGLYRSWIRGNKTQNNGDAGRFMALNFNLRQLVAEAIPGDFAEIGVWRGNSAAILAHYAAQSGRRLFLFDTFTGFDPRDMVGIDETANRDFSDTSIQFVRETVRHDELTTYLPGFFPETVTDEVRSRTFALAHIDCDLYEPMKAGLEFFYPRMSPGGMLILHDYSSGTWAGATRAVDEFCRATGEFITLWPDKSGTAMIRKRR
jgi:Macrocin-O-methyltransferase (TylF)